MLSWIEETNWIVFLLKMAFIAAASGFQSIAKRLID